jgi:predicted nucleic acid-binding protein
MEELRRALRQYVVLPYDAAVAEQWAPMYTKLTGHLHNGGTNDLWTAACALTQPNPVPIVTNNIGDFRAIARHFPIALVHPTSVLEG